MRATCIANIILLLLLFYLINSGHMRDIMKLFICPLKFGGKYKRRLGGVVVSVLATGSKGCGFKTRPKRWIFKGDKIRSTPSSRMGSKAGRSHVVRFYGILKNS
jgi:hypothetical protein